MLNDLPIQWVNSFTYLGVVIDKGLRFHKHAQYLLVVDRATNAVNAIRILASLSGVNLSILRRIFNAIVRPILDYGAEVFACCLHHPSSPYKLHKTPHSRNALALTTGRPPITCTESSIYCQLITDRSGPRPNLHTSYRTVHIHYSNTSIQNYTQPIVGVTDSGPQVRRSPNKTQHSTCHSYSRCYRTTGSDHSPCKTKILAISSLDPDPGYSNTPRSSPL